jgi:hypothetical protein
VVNRTVLEQTRFQEKLRTLRERAEKR